MIGSTRAIRVFATAQPAHLRNGLIGLHGIVRSEFDHELLDGDSFWFVNKRRKSTRILLWDGTPTACSTWS